MAINRTSPKKGKVVDIPDAPTIGTATAGPVSATVAYTAATKGGPASTYTALSSPGSFTGTGSSSPITVTGLTAGTAYTFTVRGGNATGNGEYSSASNSITALVSPAFESIATVNVGAGGSSSIDFTSIPQTYKHLQVRVYTPPMSTSGDSYIRARFNGDTGNNYSFHVLSGNGSSAASSNSTAQTSLACGVMTGASNSSLYVSSAIIDIVDYTNTSKNKVIRAISGIEQNTNHGVGGTSQLQLFGSAWFNTSAVTSISFPAPAGTFTQYTSFALYGIKG